MQSKRVLREGGFNLRKFVTNSTTLQKRINETEAEVRDAYADNSKTRVEEEDKTYTKNLLGGRLRQSENEQKILGVTWNFVNDELIFNLNELAIQIKGTEPTKRKIVAIATKFYNPIGFVAPVIIRFKTLFQELCTSKITWDEPLSGELLIKRKRLVSEFQGVTTSIPRCYFELLAIEEGHCSLIGFCDASAGAYAAVLSTLLLARLISSVLVALEANIQLQPHCCFSDSKVALFWIKVSLKSGSHGSGTG